MARRLGNWLDELERTYSILAVDQKTARHYAAIRAELKKKGKPIPENDIWIAALAVQHRLKIISQDAHFDRIKAVRRVGW